MKIALVAPYFYPVEGGRERTVLYLAEGLAKKGHIITVFTTDRMPDGKKVKLEQENFQFSVNRIKSAYLAFRFEIPLKIQKISDYDMIHIISTDDLFTFFFLFLAKILRMKVVATVFTPFALLRHPMKILRLPLSVFEVISFISILMADRIQVKNEIDFECIKRFKKEVETIPDGIPSYYFKKEPEMGFRSKHGLEGKKILLFVNRIHPLKGPQVLIKALPYVTSKFPNAFAVFIGPNSDGYTEKLKRLAERDGISNILFLGFVSEGEKIAAYDAADVVVIPSIGEFTEAFSLVLSEAWARNRTVVVSSSRALRSRVKSGTGYVSKEGDSKSLAYAIIKAIDKPSSAPKVYSWEEVVDKIEGMYKRAYR